MQPPDQPKSTTDRFKESLSMAGHIWPHTTNSCTVRCFFFGNYFYAKNLRHSFSPSRDIDDQRILQSDWTGTHLINDLKVYLVHDKNTFFPLQAGKC